MVEPNGTIERLAEALSGRYHVRREVGAGGMATVYLADDLKHDRQVAIKVMRPELAASMGAERFLREIQISAKLNHPHILTLIDSGEVGGILYYVMPFVAGESLRDKLEREGQLPLGEALEIAREVADALGYAHRLDVIHRDIKPGNVLLSEGHAIVTDFGIARAVGAAAGSMTRTGGSVGSPLYMSPEQAAGRPNLDGRSDLYSLACMLFEMLAGEPPFSGHSMQALIAKHAMEPPPDVRVLRSSVPEPLDEAIRKALAKSPADRHRTVAEFAGVLSRAARASATSQADHEPGAPTRERNGPSPSPRTPGGQPETASRWSRVLGLSVAAVVMISLGVFIGTRGGPGATVDPGQPGEESASPIRTELPLSPQRIAVLPFRLVGESEELTYLGTGFAEALIDALRSVSSVDVIPVNGVLPYDVPDLRPSAIAEGLQAGTVVRGTINVVQGMMTLAVRVFDGNSGEQTQQGSISVPAPPTGDLLSARSQLIVLAARLLGEHLGGDIGLSQPVPTAVGSPFIPNRSEAWRAYLQGQEAFREGDALTAGGDRPGAVAAFDRALDLLAEAAARDSSWVDPITASGWAAYRKSRAVASLGETLAQIDLGMALAERALRRAPRAPDALNLRGTLQYWRWLLDVTPDPDEQASLLEEAQSDLEEAVELDPSLATAWSALSHLYYVGSDVTGALLAARRAVEEDQYHPAIQILYTRLINASQDAGRFSVARDFCEDGAAAFPENPRFLRCQISLMSTPGGVPDPGRAWDLFELASAMTPAATKAYYDLEGRVFVARVLARAALPDSARHVLESVRAATTREIDPGGTLLFLEAHVRAALGDHEQAVELLRFLKASGYFSEGDDSWVDHWFWDDLREHAGFRELTGS